MKESARIVWVCTHLLKLLDDSPPLLRRTSVYSAHNCSILPARFAPVNIDFGYLTPTPFEVSNPPQSKLTGARFPFGSTLSLRADEAAGTGRTADSYSGLRELVRASGRLLLWSGRPLSAPTPLSLACSSAPRPRSYGGPRRRKWVGILPVGAPGRSEFYLAVPARISAS
jgi:hypothetical protein